MKRFLLMGIVASGLVFAPVQAEAGSSRQQVLVTTTVVGAATGAVIGSGSNQTLEGALIGGMIGAAAGIILAPQEQVATYRTAYHRQPTYRHVYARPAYRALRYASYHPVRAHRAGGRHAYHEYVEHEARRFGEGSRGEDREHAYDEED